MALCASEFDVARANSWFSTDAGLALLASESELLASALSERPLQPWLYLGPNINHDYKQRISNCGLCLYRTPEGLKGDLFCSEQSLPVASESVATVVIQHAINMRPNSEQFLKECSRILIPGGRVWLFALNPLSAYRLRYRGYHLSAAEPLSWRRKLRRFGLIAEAVSRGVGPSWKVEQNAHAQLGTGTRAAYVIMAEKRSIPMTPVRQRARGLRQEPAPV